jgi:hypothetical protein
MLKKSVLAAFFTGILCFGAQSARCQMVVHAVSGTVKAINPASKSVDVDIEDGSKGHFKTSTKSSVAISFDNDLRGDAVDASDFHDVGSFAVIYYYGFDSNRTAVAIKALGKGPFEKTSGKVVDFNKHDRLLTVRKSTGGNETFRLSDKAVVDAGRGIQSGQKYNPNKGYSVRVTSTQSNGENVAVFVWSRR